MANDHLNYSQNKYELFLSNHADENQADENSISTSSEFSATCLLDLNPLLFLRSNAAQVSLNQLSIDNLALCYSQNEAIKVYFNSDTEHLMANKCFLKDSVKQENSKPLSLGFNDFSATKPQETLDHVNSLLNTNLNLFICHRLSQTVIDKELFTENIFLSANTENPLSLSSNEIKLLLRYLDYASMTRFTHTKILDEILSTTSNLKMSLSNIKPILTSDLEESTLHASEVLKSKADREKDKKIIFELFSIDSFYDIDLSTNNTRKTDLVTKLRTDFIEYLTIMEIDIHQPATADRDLLTTLLRSTIDLFNQGTTLRNILLLELKKLKSTFNDDFFITNLVALKLDETRSKCKFVINNKLFLPNNHSTLILIIPSHAAYSLGSSKNKATVSIGPISYNTDTKTSLTPRITKNILSEKQRLPCSIRFHPRILRVATDIITTNGIVDNWLGSTDNSNFNILHSFTIDEAHMQSRFISKTDSELNPHRIMKTENFLDQIKIKILDENCNKIFFPVQTLTYCSLIIEPITFD